jgi:hypothetical protein
MSSLCSILPLFLGEICTTTDPHYSNFLLLLKIFASLQCISFTEDDLLKVENKIEMHHNGFLELY